MKLTIERAALLRTLAHVQSVVERRTTIPILAHLRVEASEGGLGVTATDMDVAVIVHVAAEIGQEGATTSAAHMMYDIVRKLPEGAQIDLDSDVVADHLTVSCGNARFSLPSLPADEFPAMAEGEFSHEFELPAPNLIRLVDKTRFAISTEETRYYLNGIFIHAVEGNGRPLLRAVATDGHRLSRVDIPLPEGAQGIPGVIVPRKTVGELRKLVDEVEGNISVSVSETKIRFAFEDTVLTSKLIDGRFPDYEQVIPEKNDKEMEIDGRSFTEAVDRVATISTEKTRSVKLALSKGRLVVSANNPDSGSASEEIEASYESDDLQIGFNSRYLLDATGQVSGERIRLMIADSVSPTVMRDTGDSDALYVLMPMRV
jgi:DNA polymerase-3 subunit beta